MKKIIFLLFNNYLNLNDRKKNRVVVQRSQFVSFVFFLFFFCRLFFYNCRSKDWFEVSYFFSYTHRKKKKKKKERPKKTKNKTKKKTKDIVFLLNISLRRRRWMLDSLFK